MRTTVVIRYQRSRCMDLYSVHYKLYTVQCTVKLEKIHHFTKYLFQNNSKKIINFLKLIYIIILYINLSDQIVLNCGYKLYINVLYTNIIKKIKKYVNLFCISYFK